MFDANDKTKVSQHRVEKLRVEIEKHAKTKIKPGSPLDGFVEDLIRMSELVKDRNTKTIFLDPYASLNAKEPQWHQVIRSKIQKVIELSKDTKILNIYPLEELYNQIGNIIFSNRNPAHHQKSKHKGSRSFDMWSLVPNNVSDELQSVKNFLKQYYFRSTKRLR